MENSSVNFECSSCGLCCQKVGKAVKDARQWMLQNKGKRADPIMKAKASFPFKFTDKGVCEKLVDGLCSVYETRPDICSVERTFTKFFDNQGTRTREAFFGDNAKLCNTWITKAGLDPAYLVKENYL